MKIRLLFIGILLTMTQGAWAQGSGDDTSEPTPIEISSVAQLNQLSVNVRAKNSDGYQGKYIELKNDLDFSEVALFDTDGDGEPDSNFWPIGYSDENNNNPFRGIFNGGGHTIKGITVNRPGADWIGLFGLIEGATIKNLRIEGCTFVGNTCVGAVVGQSNTRIEGSEPNDAAKGVDPSDDLSKNNIEPSECYISDCYVADGVSVKATANEGGIAGGIFGYAYWTTASNCVSAALVEGTGNVGGVGGEMGWDGALYVSLNDCYYIGGKEELKVYGSKNQGAEFCISLLDDDSDTMVRNDTRLRNYAGEYANVTLTGRTLYMDGTWNTLCLPVDVMLDDENLGIDEARTLQGASFDGETGTLMLDFSEVEQNNWLWAGVPYLIRWKNPEAADDDENVMDLDLTFKAEINAEPTTIERNGVSFVGTYSTVQFPGATSNVLYLGVENKLFYPKSAMNIHAFRAYFKLDESLFGADSPNSIREFHLDFGEETGIQMVLADERAAADADAWYTLDGRRLAGRPAAKGIYLKGGKTICITE